MRFLHATIPMTRHLPIPKRFLCHISLTGLLRRSNTAPMDTTPSTILTNDLALSTVRAPHRHFLVHGPTPHHSMRKLRSRAIAVVQVLNRESQTTVRELAPDIQTQRSIPNVLMGTYTGHSVGCRISFCERAFVRHEKLLQRPMRWTRHVQMSAFRVLGVFRCGYSEMSS